MTRRLKHMVGPRRLGFLYTENLFVEEAGGP
jgi:hypothetical protein